MVVGLVDQCLNEHVFRLSGGGQADHRGMGIRLQSGPPPQFDWPNTSRGVCCALSIGTSSSQFIMKPGIEAFDVAILHRPARLNQNVTDAKGLRGRVLNFV